MLDRIGPGTALGEYVVQSRLGAGGHATVFVVRHGETGARAAAKVLDRDACTADLLRRFRREIALLRALDHPAIIRVFDDGLLPDGRPWYVMELLGGDTLADLLRDRGRLPPAEAATLGAAVCDALQVVHDAGLVHRDVKPANVMFTRSLADDMMSVKLLDFGIAKAPPAAGSGVTTVGRALGTPAYMAPEQIRGEEVDARADLYAAGVVAYELATGRPPFDDDDELEIERLHLEAAPRPPSALVPAARALDAVILRCLQKEPRLRFASAAEVAAALRAVR
jgi:serine/threonine-protein kinase